MIVYGKRRKKYVLSQSPVSQEYDGAVYSVPADRDILVKIYQPEYRTSETEKLVIDTANGKCSMLDESPVDVVYSNGRFAGYIFETSAPLAPVVEEVPQPPVRQSVGLNDLSVLLICIAAGLGLSALTYYVIFDNLRAMIGDPYCFWNFNGIPMIIGGWALMLTACFRFRDGGVQAVVISVIAFLLGAVAVFAVIALLVWLLTLAWTLVKAILPTVLVIVIMIWLLKMFLGK